MTTIVATIAYISGFAIVVATVVLAYENRNSPETIKAAGVIVGGVAISLVTMYLSFQNEHTLEYFSSTLLVGDRTGIPANTTLAYIADSFPEFEQVLWHHEWVRRGFRLMFKDHPELAGNLYTGTESKTYGAELEGRYADIVFDQVLGKLLERFGSGWNVEFRQYRLFGRPSLATVGSREKELESTILAGKDLSEKLQFSDRLFKQYEDPHYKLYLPPNSSFVTEGAGSWRRIVVTNPFVELTVTFSPQGGENVEPESRVLRNLGIGDGQRYRAILYDIEIERTFNGLRLGHPKMQEYRTWTNQFVDSIRSILDDEGFWKAIASPLLPPPPEGYGLPPSIKENGPTIPPLAVPFEVDSIYYDNKLTSDELEGLGEVVLRMAPKGLRLGGIESWDSWRKSEGAEADEILRLLKNGRTITILSPDSNKKQAIQLSAVLSETCKRVPEFAGYSVLTMNYGDVAKRTSDQNLKKELAEGSKDSPSFIFVARPSESQAADDRDSLEHR
jgi:hypothetical protein